jgi:hypothetical protein
MQMERESPTQIQSSAQSLSDEERTRLHQLEHTVEETLKSFLECGRALLEVRDRTLYRECYKSFDDYLIKRWAITYSQGASLMRSTLVAEHLLSGPAGPQGDAPLPLDLAESTLRPLQKLAPELQCAVWRLASRVTEKPSAHIVSRIVRTVTAAIHYDQDQGQSNGGAPPSSEAKRAQKAVFLASVHRLAAGDGFNAEVVGLRISNAEQAKRCSTSCRVLIGRCMAVLAELERRFPGIN